MRLYLLLLAFIVTTACASDPMVRVGGEQFNVRIANTPSARQLGLMYVKEMPSNEGMLFIFDDERRRSFWMKNTLIALDILYFSAERKLVSMQLDAQPCRSDPCRSYPSAGPAKYVLELNAGVGQRLALEEGDSFDLSL